VYLHNLLDLVYSYGTATKLSRLVGHGERNKKRTQQRVNPTIGFKVIQGNAPLAVFCQWKRARAKKRVFSHISGTDGPINVPFGAFLSSSRPLSACQVRITCSDRIQTH